VIKSAKRLGLVGLTLGLAAVARAQQPPPMPKTTDGDSMARWGEKMGQWGQQFGERMGKWGESLGNQIGQAFNDTAFQNAMNRDPEVMHDPEVKAAMRRMIQYNIHHDPRARDAQQQFRDAIQHAEARRYGHRGMIPPIPPVPPLPPMPPMHAMPGGELSSAMKADIDRVRHDPTADPIPATNEFVVGPRRIDSAQQVTGPVATVDGPVEVLGTVNGDVDVVDGDIIVRPSGHITGNAFAAHGMVHVMDGGVVDGEMRSLPEAIGPTSIVTSTPRAGRSPWRSLELSIAWLCLALVMGIGVLTFAGERLDTTSLALSDQFGRSLLFGVIGLLAVMPILTIVVVLLCVTIVGIIVVPIAVVAYVLMVLGIAVLGFTSVAETTGHAFFRRSAHGLSDRGARLRAVVTGIAFYIGLWVLAAAAGWAPVAGAVLHAVAGAATGLAVTAGFGAVLAARYDARRRPLVDTPLAASGTPSLSNVAWATPTPVGGVAAARRPTPPPPQAPVQ
jgi:hypothetical protein